MSVIVKIECQQCEAIHADELDCILVLGYRGDQIGIWYHDTSIAGTLDLISKYLRYIAENMAREEEEEDGKENAPDRL